MKSAGKAGLSAGRAARCHTHQHPSDLGRKKVDEQVFQGVFGFGCYPLKEQWELENLERESPNGLFGTVKRGLVSAVY